MVMMKTIKVVMNDYQHGKTRPRSTQAQCTGYPCRLHARPAKEKDCLVLKDNGGAEEGHDRER